MAPSAKPPIPVVAVRPDKAVQMVTSGGRQPRSWPAWIMIRWEESFLFKRLLDQLWAGLGNLDQGAERVVLHVKDSASAQAFFREISSSSLLAETRLVIAHVSRPIRRFIDLDVFGRELLTASERTLPVLAVEGMAKLDEESARLALASAGCGRKGMEIAVWRPYDRDRALDIAREIIGVCGVRADDLTLNFWLDRLGSNLDRLQSEARRMKILLQNDEVTQERLEEVFEVPHVHDETVWDILRHVLDGDGSKAAAHLKAFLQSTDAFLAASELTRILLCLQALSLAAREGASATPAETFLRFEMKGKRRQDKLLGLASRFDGSSLPIHDLASRLLALDLAVKQSKTAGARQEVVVRTFLALCREPQPAA